MMHGKRNGLKWSIPEILRLQREWELLNLSSYEIAKLHKRTQLSIRFKLVAEGFVEEMDVFQMEDN